MKKLIISLLLSLFLVSCVTAQTLKKDPHAKITVENIKTNCTSVENWTVGVLGMPGIVLRFDNCLDIKILLVVATDVETQTEEIRRLSMKLLAIHYSEYLKRQEPIENENIKKVYSIKKIKEENSQGWLTYYYSITYKKVECINGTCKEKQE